MLGMQSHLFSAPSGSPVEPKAPKAPYLVLSSRRLNDRIVLVANRNVLPPPELVHLARYSVAELEPLKDVCDELLQAIHRVKKVWPAAKVESVGPCIK